MSSISSCAFIPLIRIPAESPPPLEVAKSLVNALQTSGFLLVTTPLVPLELQTRPLEAATAFLEKSTEVIVHPTDPKRYAMLESPSQIQQASPILEEYKDALEKAKVAILQCIAVGLDLEATYFSRLHSENNSCMRLLQYPPGTSDTGNRCKEHSDYGTVTLLCTDGVSGLEALHKGKWLPVPHVKGALVVNVGSLMSDWTGGSLLATLHRVAGPASTNSNSSKETLLQAVEKSRTSIAFFADPNRGLATRIQGQTGGTRQDNTSVAEYIQWRSGGSDENRSGVAFTDVEEKRVQRE